jgi:hypothetical protein
VLSQYVNQWFPAGLSYPLFYHTIYYTINYIYGQAFDEKAAGGTE